MSGAITKYNKARSIVDNVLTEERVARETLMDKKQKRERLEGLIRIWAAEKRKKK